MTKRKRICRHKHDAKLGYHTHDSHGVDLQLNYIVHGEGVASALFTRRGLKALESIRRDRWDGDGYIIDTLGNIY